MSTGIILAVGLQGGGLWAAKTFAPKKDEKNKPITFILYKPPPPPPPPPPKPEPKPEPPKPEPKPEPKKKKPKPKKKKRLKKKKPKPKKKAPPPKPETAPDPKPPPKKPVPLQVGLTLGSTTKGGRGPVMQIGNTQMGEVGSTAKKAVTERATPGPAVKPQPKAPPVTKKARPKKRIKPKYTRAALKAEIEGTIVLRAYIDARGRVTKVKLIKGLGYGLDEAAIAAVKRWSYYPKTIDGEPVKSAVTQKVEFIIED